jgi:hypothetical protein
MTPQGKEADTGKWLAQGGLEAYHDFFGSSFAFFAFE